MRFSRGRVRNIFFGGVPYIYQGDGVWVWGDDGGLGSSTCLITGDGNLEPGNDTVEDQFAGEYEFSYWEYGTDLLTYVSQEQIIVSRVSLCRWEMKNATFGYYGDEGLVTFQQDVVLQYAVKWRIDTFYTGEDFMVSTYTGIKQAPQSAPDAPTGDEPFPDLAHYDEFVYL